MYEIAMHKKTIGSVFTDGQRNIVVRKFDRSKLIQQPYARDDMMAVASAGPYSNYLHLAPDR